MDRFKEIRIGLIFPNWLCAEFKNLLVSQELNVVFAQSNTDNIPEADVIIVDPPCVREGKNIIVYFREHFPKAKILLYTTNQVIYENLLKHVDFSVTENDFPGLIKQIVKAATGDVEYADTVEHFFKNKFSKNKKQVNCHLLNLTSDEIKILKAVSEGQTTNKEIAIELATSVSTVVRRLEKFYAKLGIQEKHELILYASKAFD